MLLTAAAMPAPALLAPEIPAPSYRLHYTAPRREGPRSLLDRRRVAAAVLAARTPLAPVSGHRPGGTQFVSRRPASRRRHPRP
jgi:hypothetical protein